MKEIYKLELYSYLLFISGVIGDILSSKLCLSIPYIVEGNSFILYLMQKGLLLPYNILVLTLGILIPHYLIKIYFEKVGNIPLIFPFVSGIVRLLATCWNIYLFILAIS